MLGVEEVSSFLVSTVTNKVTTICIQITLIKLGGSNSLQGPQFPIHTIKEKGRLDYISNQPLTTN